MLFYVQFVQFFLGGKCKYGSTCKFKHSKEGDSTEAMRQVIAYKLLYYSDQPNVKNLTESLLQDQKRQRTESSYGPSRERRVTITKCHLLYY